MTCKRLWIIIKKSSIIKLVILETIDDHFFKLILCFQNVDLFIGFVWEFRTDWFSVTSCKCLAKFPKTNFVEISFHWFCRGWIGKTFNNEIDGIFFCFFVFLNCKQYGDSWNFSPHPCWFYARVLNGFALTVEWKLWFFRYISMMCDFSKA